MRPHLFAIAALGACDSSSEAPAIDVVLVRHVDRKTSQLSPIEHGVLMIGERRLQLVLKLRREGDGFAATLDSPDQNAWDLPVDGVVVSRPAGLALWQLFGTTNQLLAGLTAGGVKG